MTSNRWLCEHSTKYRLFVSIFVCFLMSIYHFLFPENCLCRFWIFAISDDLSNRLETNKALASLIQSQIDRNWDNFFPFFCCCSLFRVDSISPSSQMFVDDLCKHSSRERAIEISVSSWRRQCRQVECAECWTEFEIKESTLSIVIIIISLRVEFVLELVRCITLDHVIRKRIRSYAIHTHTTHSTMCECVCALWNVINSILDMAHMISIVKFHMEFKVRVYFAFLAVSEFSFRMA